MSARRRARHVVVVGAGISGLATAYHLLRGSKHGDPIEVTVLEAGGRAGGKVWTIQMDGMPMEAGADSFVVRKPWAVDLCKDLGLEGQVVIPGAMGASVWAARGLVPYPDRAPFGIPSDVGDLLGWPGLRRPAKLRAMLDLVRPPRRGRGDEALGALLRRRLGVKVSRTMVEPLLAGLHAGDPLRLSVLATFPELAAWERDHGSLLRAARIAGRTRDEEQGRQPMFATVWGGLSQMVERLVARIGGDRVLLDAPVRGLEIEGHVVRVVGAGASYDAEAVVLAIPAFEAARLTEGIPDAARELAGIPYVSTAVVSLVYPEGTADRLPDGTGFVVPVGRSPLTACTWISRKWPHPAFGERAVVRCFIGRAGQEGELSGDDASLVDLTTREVAHAVGLRQRPERTRVIRWHRAMPQYEVGHLDRVARIELALAEAPGVFVTGSAYGGVGIADCIRQGEEAAGRVTSFLRRGGPSDPAQAPDEDQEAISWTS
jgi:oxygen-dependent protoporphyrinogen oxidase